MIQQIDHIGIAVKSLDATVPYYRDALGLGEPHIEEVPTQKVRVAMFDVAGVHIELLEPTSPESAIAKAIEKKGEGIHHIAFKTNDIAGNTGPSTLEMIEDNLASMAQLAKANGIKVILCSVLPAFDYPWRPGMEPNVKIPELNKWIKAYAEKNKFIYVDYFSAMADDRNGLPSDLSKDGVHPNKKGYEIMQPMVEKAIAKALK